MIIIKLSGGLGNQMFQYAAGRALSLTQQVPLKLDISLLAEDHKRSLDLFHFPVVADIATDEEIMKLFPQSNVEKAIQYFLPARRKKYFRERHFHFSRKILCLGPEVYLKGHFQSEKNFSGHANRIRQDFTFRKESISQMEEYTVMLKNDNSVAIHIRRGDYEKDPESLKYHGLLHKDYYMNAIELIRSKLNNPSFYIFSDQINWIKEILHEMDAVQVSGEVTKNHIEDLYLMSQCRHQIIANSSFSWWGAWLNENPEKIIIAPKKWFNKGPKDTQDLIPEGWIRI